MTFKDILKNSFLEGFRSDIGTVEIVLTMIISTIVGFYIYCVYKMKTKTSFYSGDFNNALATLPVITAGIVLAMQSSIVISLGMVGALSIVRFRNAVKSSLDLTFLFWSISAGIITGAGLYEIIVILSVIVTMILFGLDLLPAGKAPYTIVLNSGNMDVKTQLEPVLKKTVSWYKIRSVSKSKHRTDVVVRFRSKNVDMLINELSAQQFVDNFNILAMDGEAQL